MIELHPIKKIIIELHPCSSHAWTHQPYDVDMRRSIHTCPLMSMSRRPCPWRYFPSLSDDFLTRQKRLLVLNINEYSLLSQKFTKECYSCFSITQTVWILIKVIYRSNNIDNKNKSISLVRVIFSLSGLLICVRTALPDQVATCKTCVG